MISLPIIFMDEGNDEGNTIELPNGMVFEFLRPMPARDASKDTPLIKAILSDDITQVENCIKELQENKSLAEALLIPEASGKNAFAFACSRKTPNVEIIKKLLPHINAEVVNMKDASEKTAFSYIINDDELEEFEDFSYELIRSGWVNPTIQDKEGNNALMLAISNNHEKTTQLLLSANVQQLMPLLQMCNKEGRDALDMALENGEYDIAARMLQLGCDIEARDIHGKTRLMRAIEELPDHATQFLFQYKANINSINVNGDSILIQLVKAEEDYLVRYAIEQGADISIRDAQGKTALEIARSLSKDGEASYPVKFLAAEPIRRSMPIDYKKMCIDALQQGDLETLIYADKVFGEKFFSTPFEDGTTPLHIAAKLGHLDIVEHLLDEKEKVEGVHCNIEDNLGNTPLMCAAAAGHMDIIRFLCQKGAQKLKKNNANESAFDIATRNNRRDAAQYFQEQESLYTLSVPSLGLSRDSVIRKNSSSGSELTPEVLLPKGYALLLENFNQKDRAQGKNVPSHYFADSIESLEHALSLLKQAKEGTEYGLLVPINGHYVAIKCEKLNGRNHIILMDSLGSLEFHPGGLEYEGNNHAEALENIVAKVFAGEVQNILFYKNEEARQTSGEICGTFSVKDLRKMLAIRSFSQVLHQDKHITENSNVNGMTILSYRTPPEFMRLAQSPDNLDRYAKKHKEQAEKELRRNKNGQPQRFIEYALTPREKFGMQTPERTVNRNYGPNKPNEPQYDLFMNFFPNRK